MKAKRAHGFVPLRRFPQACTCTALSRPFRHRFGPVQLPPLYVPVRPSPVSREAGRDLWRSIGPSTTVVFKLRRSLSANKTTDLNSKFRAKRPVYLRHMSRRDSRNGCFWRKTADLHTSGGKRAEPWPAEVKSDESWQSAWRWRRGVRHRQGRSTNDEAGPS